VRGKKVAKVSADGEEVFRKYGGAAWSRAMKQFLTQNGKSPSDLVYAQMWDPAGGLAFDAGAFRLAGVGAPALRKAIVESSRPGAPGLKVSGGTLAGRPVTRVVYASGAKLYLYEHGDVVFYAGAGNEKLAADIVAMFP
jgi:hypothetical protein